MIEKKLVALSLICVILCVAVVGAVMVVNQKDYELQMKADQISGLEDERLSLEAQVATLQFNMSGLQSEIASLSNEKTALENQVSTLQANISSFQTEATVLENEKNTLEMQVSALQANISGLQSEIVSLNNDKIALEAQVATLQFNMSGLQSEIASLSNEKTALENQVSTLQANITSLQTEIASLENEVIESFNLGYAEGEAAGYQVGYDEGYAQGVEDGAGSGWYIRDPTYAEAIAFINSDRTDENEYTEDYVCYDFTADFNSNAFQMGYRCGFVYIEFEDGAHAIACFNTTDEGLIYIEPQNDKIVDVAVGQSYWGDIIVKIGIIW
jgi:predicted  nucleic acid-binding Zn-ribbon protein